MIRVLLAVGVLLGSQEPSRPNFVFVLVDDLRADPIEMKNLVAVPAAAVALKEMKEELARLEAELR